MKKLTLITILTLHIFQLSAQINWFQEGAKWTYDYSSFTSSGTIFLEYQGDTIVNNLTLKKVSHQGIYVNWSQNPPTTHMTTHEPMYFYQENNAMIQYGATQLQGYNTAGIIYDFDSNVGDTLDYFEFGGDQSMFFVLDSMGYLEIDNQNLAFQDIKVIDSLTNYNGILRVIERVGSISNFFVTNFTVLQPFDAASYLFRCYEDETISVNLSWYEHECDYIPEVVTAVDDVDISKIKIYPNPVSNILYVDLEKSKIVEFKIFSVTGQQLWSQQIGSEAFLNIDLSAINNGFYYLVGYDKYGNIRSTDKVIKN